MNMSVLAAPVSVSTPLSTRQVSDGSPSGLSGNGNPGKFKAATCVVCHGSA
jgi:hypothetical protein